jgi:hypothetical protein
MALIISTETQERLASQKPPVSIGEITECFATRTGRYLLDRREDHGSEPKTKWFISETYYGRRLKVIFRLENNDVVIRAASWANDEEVRIYGKFSTQ